MEKLFGTVGGGFDTAIGGLYWVIDTGWNIWSGLFSPLPYGDPYIAIAAAMIVFYMASKIIVPGNQTY